MDLSSKSVTTLKGVGPKLAEKLKRLNIISVQDVLFHLPLRYQDRTRLVPIANLATGIEVVCCGTVTSSEVLFRRRRSLLCVIADNKGNQLALRFFHFNQQQQQRLRVGARVRCFGEVRRGPNLLEMVHPEFETLGASEDVHQGAESALTPVYPVTEGLHQISMRKITDAALVLFKNAEIQELLPATRKENISLKAALLEVHRPGASTDIDALLLGTHAAVQRLALEELVAHRLSVQQARNQIKTHNAPTLSGQSKLCVQLIESLPFKLTGAQNKVIKEIRQDCYQVAVMAPTEILAEQHLLSFNGWFEPLGLKIGWLKGKLGARQKRDAIESIALGQTKIAVGTHALFQQDVSFQNLGLTIVDEQHRFGVHQRLSLREKGIDADTVPHQLTMTATPIPRTLAMTTYADLDCSMEHRCIGCAL